jgi:hypothetical protein
MEAQNWKIIEQNIFLCFIDMFWKDIMINLNKNEYVILLFLVHYKEGDKFGYVTLGPAFRTYNSKEEHFRYEENIMDEFRSFEENYKDIEFQYLIIQYWVRENTSDLPVELLYTLKSIKKTINPPLELNKIIKNNFDHYDIPLNKDYLSWGNVIQNQNGAFYLIQDKKDGNKYYQIYIHKKYATVEVRKFSKIILTFEDRNIKFKPFTTEYLLPDYILDSYIKKEEFYIFARTIKNSEFYVKVFLKKSLDEIIDGEILLKTIKYKTEHMQITKKENKITNKFITLDIETMVLNGVHIPYNICFFDGYKSYSFYLSNYKDHLEMIEDALNNLFRPKYTGYIVYVHNLSAFDGIFLLYSLSKMSSDKEKDIKITPVFKDKSMINKVNFSKYTINFRDSYLMLPISLKKLSIQFKVDHVKTVFPYDFLNDKFNDNIDLNYTGSIPDVTYFSGKTLTEKVENYSKYLIEAYEINNNLFTSWSLKDETERYCINDCISLHEILTKFNEEIFRKFKINIHNTPTLPALSIFRSNFLGKLEKDGYRIPLIDGKLYDDIRVSYTGGSTEMYIPSNLTPQEILHPSDNNKNNQLVKCYDVNSLYPTNMAKDMLMPVVSKNKNYITYFEGDISLKDSKPFGFFNTIVKTPTELAHPILQIRYDTSTLGGTGIKTISPLGHFSSMFFSEEIYNSEKYGYKHDIKSGYLFDKHDVFKEFIDEIFKIKQKHTPNDPWYIISKLLLNSLYGKFGQNPQFDKHVIINVDELNNYQDNFEILESTDLFNNNLLIRYRDRPGRLENFSKFNNKKNVSIPLASAITSYARIFMSEYKNNSKYILLYTDTDSAFIIGDFEQKLIGKELGQWKLENTFKKIIFLSPKVYCGITVDDKVVVKIKGFKNKIPFDDFKLLLQKGKSIDLAQEKWFKSIVKGNITIKDESYNLTATQNKRELIYKDNILVGTRPFIINTVEKSISNIRDMSLVKYNND